MRVPSGEIVGSIHVTPVLNLAAPAAVFAEEDENLQFADIINRGIEVAAQRSGFSLLISSVDADDANAGDRVLALARKCDGLIVHDLVLAAGQLDQLGSHVPVVNLAGVTTPRTARVLLISGRFSTAVTS